MESTYLFKSREKTRNRDIVNVIIERFGFGLCKERARDIRDSYRGVWAGILQLSNQSKDTIY